LASSDHDQSPRQHLATGLDPEDIDPGRNPPAVVPSLVPDEMAIPWLLRAFEQRPDERAGHAIDTHSQRLPLREDEMD